MGRQNCRGAARGEKGTIGAVAMGCNCARCPVRGAIPRPNECATAAEGNNWSCRAHTMCARVAGVWSRRNAPINRTAHAEFSSTKSHKQPNAAKVQTALKLSQEDQNTIASLKREIEKAWKMVDASHEKEARAKETISQLKTEIANLSRLVEQGAGLSMGQENTLNELMRDKEVLTQERDAQVCYINTS